MFLSCLKGVEPPERSFRIHGVPTAIDINAREFMFRRTKCNYSSGCGQTDVHGVRAATRFHFPSNTNNCVVRTSSGVQWNQSPARVAVVTAAHV